MSMILALVALPDEELEQLAADPARAFDLVDSTYDDESNDTANLDKAWHGIHYLLTGTAWEGEAPENTLVAGGTELPDPDEEWGYGPPRCVGAVSAAAFARAVEAITDDELAARFDPADMTAKEIYPPILDRDPSEDDTLGYLMEYVAVLRQFLASAAAQNRGFLVALT
jgi:Domain of unknown function (DUF1877)